MCWLWPWVQRPAVGHSYDRKGPKIFMKIPWVMWSSGIHTTEILTYDCLCVWEHQSVALICNLFHLMALLHTPPAAVKDLWLEWLDVMVASVLLKRLLCNQHFILTYFWLAVDIRGVMWWYNPLMRVQPFNEGHSY